MFSYVKNCQLVFKVIEVFYTPTTGVGVWELPCFSHSGGCVLACHLDFEFAFP
jgi:hypothetical protein